MQSIPALISVLFLSIAVSAEDCGRFVAKGIISRENGEPFITLLKGSLSETKLKLHTRSFDPRLMLMRERPAEITGIIQEPIHRFRGTMKVEDFSALFLDPPSTDRDEVLILKNKMACK